MRRCHSILLLFAAALFASAANAQTADLLVSKSAPESVTAGEATIVRAWNRRTLSEALAFEPQILAKFAVAMCELLVERLRDTARRV